MKRKITLYLLIISVFFITWAGIQDSNGKLGNTGSPGEATCSQSGCHGAGNGGLADNAGPGSIAITTVPAMTNNKYIASQTYAVSVTVSETGKGLFGLDFEALDNSGSTTTSVNNSVGTIAITNSASTRKSQPFGTGRVNVTHQTNGGLTTNSHVFTFNWTAPVSGVVNFYAAGIAANHNGSSDSGDNVYKTSMQLSLSTTTGVEQNNVSIKDLNVFPNPIANQVTINLSFDNASDLQIKLFDVEGRLKTILANENNIIGNYNHTFELTGNYSPGIYFLEFKTENEDSFRKVIIL